MPKPNSTPDRDPQERVIWARREPEKGAAKLWSMVQTFERTLGWRHHMAQRGAMAYSGTGLGDLFENLRFDIPWNGAAQTERRGRRKKFSGYRDEHSERHARAICSTVTEKLFGMDQPKTQMVATDAEWEVRRQGVWADRFIEGNMHLAQGPYLDFWELTRQGGLMTFCSTGTAAVRIEPDLVAKRVRSQLRSTLNTFIDPDDVANGVPLTYVDVTWENADYMCEDPRFSAAQRDRIWAASKVPPHHERNQNGPSFGTRMVKCLSAWRMPFGSFEGREALVIDDGEPLVWEKWKHPEPPLYFFRCDPSLGDAFWGENLIDIALPVLRDAEDIDDLAKRTMERSSQTYLGIDGKTTSPKTLLEAKDVNVFQFDSKKGENPPIILKPEILNQQYFEWRERKIQLAYELTGVSLMHVSGEVQGAAGNRSGASIRREASMLPERFARKLRRFRNWVAVDCAKGWVRAAQQISKDAPDWQVTWPGQDFERAVKIDVLNIDLNVYTLRPYAVNESKNTPADRAESAQEMFDRGEIDEAQLTIILEGLYDTKKETNATTEQRAYVAYTIDEMLYGEESLIENENLYMSQDYIPPPAWLDAEAALAQAGPKYLRAMIDRVPQNRRSLLRRFMEDIWALRVQQQREVAMQQASVNMAASPGEAFAPTPAFPGDPNAALGAPAAAPALPAPGGATPPALPPGAPPGGVPLNAPGPSGMV